MPSTTLLTMPMTGMKTKQAIYKNESSTQKLKTIFTFCQNSCEAQLKAIFRFFAAKMKLHEHRNVFVGHIEREILGISKNAVFSKDTVYCYRYQRINQFESMPFWGDMVALTKWDKEEGLPIESCKVEGEAQISTAALEVDLETLGLVNTLVQQPKMVAEGNFEQYNCKYYVEEEARNTHNCVYVGVPQCQKKQKRNSWARMQMYGKVSQELSDMICIPLKQEEPYMHDDTDSYGSDQDMYHFEYDSSSDEEDDILFDHQEIFNEGGMTEGDDALLQELLA